VLPGATIIAEQVETGRKFTRTSNSSGEYLFTQLPVSVYSLTVNATNFKQSALQRLEIHAGADCARTSPFRSAIRRV
jgi:hypothetical protein